MDGLRAFLKRLEEDFRTMSSQSTTRVYDVMMGLLSASLLGLVELLSYFLFADGDVAYRPMFLFTGALMESLFVVFVIVYRSRFGTRSRVWNALLHLYPYFVILVGLAITSIGLGHADGIESYLLAVFAAAFIRIYPRRHRIAVFAIGFMAFMTMILFYHGFSAPSLSALRLGLMVNLLSYLYATLNYQSHMNRIGMMEARDVEVRRRDEALVELRQLNDRLASSQRVTEAMMRTTTEILKNDRLDDVLQLVLDEAIQLIPAGQAGSILTLEQGKMHYRAAIGYNLKRLKLITLDEKDLLQARQENLYEPTIIRDLEVFDAAHLPSDKFEQFKEHGALVAKSVLTCSFKADGAFFGTINVDNFESEDAFGENDRVMIGTLALQLENVIAIHNLYERAMLPIRYDELTQAISRRQHRTLATEAIAAAAETGGTLTLGSLDLNDFKSVNDTYGHDVGDECLRAFADGVRANPTDGMVLSRIGGDEFTIVLPGIGKKEAEAYARKVRAYFTDHPFMIGEVAYIIRFAIGFSCFPEDGRDLSALMRIADQRMYLDKADAKR
ncbi:MAG: sensor domain-containing diguanylate cyclase [Candidatus Izemoplasmatales bacterium]